MAASNPAAAASASRREPPPSRRAAHVAAVPRTASTTTCQTLPYFQASESRTSQRTSRSQPARNGTSHQAQIVRAAAPTVAAQRTARVKEAPLPASRAAQTTAIPGTTVALVRTARPATTPQATGRRQRAAQAAQNNPRIGATIAGQEPKYVACWWKPGRTQCIRPDAAVSTSTAPTAPRCARGP